MRDVIQDIYGPALREYGFVPQPENHRFGPNGLCWRIDREQGEGYYWTYGQRDLFTIKIHDFYFNEDSFLEFHIPSCLSVTYYESISGEELYPHRRLSAGCVKTFLGGMEPYRVLIHKNIPITSVGIEITPSYYETRLREQYPEEYVHPLEAFRAVDQTDHFPEMVRLLEQVKNYRGEGIAAKLFYEAKAAEAVSLVVERGRARAAMEKAVSAADRQQIRCVTAYINDHYVHDISQEQLTRIACMGTTKLKHVFRQCHGCTITDYIQQRRMSHAERLLAQTELPIGQVAETVGYRSASRFAELFRKSTGLLPGEYRRQANRYHTTEHTKKP
ncbi:MAG: AraC family transcriptional regulator [Eubacteriales bacterium]|nr:AraC family transcriptional regulator [Eubacteriales bacterium]